MKMFWRGCLKEIKLKTGILFLFLILFFILGFFLGFKKAGGGKAVVPSLFGISKKQPVYPKSISQPVIPNLPKPLKSYELPPKLQLPRPVIPAPPPQIKIPTIKPVIPPELPRGFKKEKKPAS